MTSLACWRDKGQLFYCVIFQRGCAMKKSTVTCWTLDWCMELPSEKISQSRTPYDHTSLWVVKTLSKIDSGAIHFSGNRALWQNTFITHIWPLLTTDIDLPMAVHSHLPCAHSLGLCIRLEPSQNHRSSPHCCWTTGCFWQQGHDECTKNMKRPLWFNHRHIHSHIPSCKQEGRNFTLREARNSIPLATWKL